MAIGFNTASMIGTGISAGISAVGSIFTTRYNNAIAKAQANIAKENACLLYTSDAADEL